MRYEHVTVEIDRALGTASFVISGPADMPPQTPAAIHAQGSAFWPLASARELDDAMLYLRLNAGDIGTWVFRTRGDNALVEAVDAVLAEHAEHWLVREIVLYLKRVLKRLDVSSRSLMTLIEPGSCFTGILYVVLTLYDWLYRLVI